jgi:HAE1 family hydrophobic/amphiphilic exporter-1
MEYLVITNQSKFIKNTIHEVKQTAIIGGILAVLVLLYFLKNFRSTLIIGAAIPISVIITFFLMYSSNISLNIISLGGLALGIGMLVDNSIVVLESIQRYREKGEGLYKAALKGTSEVAGAVTASTFTRHCRSTVQGHGPDSDLFPTGLFSCFFNTRSDAQFDHAS